MNNYSDFLYAHPSFVGGAARVIDMGDTLTEYNQSLSPEQADQIALRSDWNAIATTFNSAFRQLAPPAKQKASKSPRRRRR